MDHRRRITLLGTAVAAALGLFVPFVSASEIGHPSVVSIDPMNKTPRVVPDADVAEPHANAIAELDGTMYAGGLFGTIFDDTTDVNIDAQNFVIFDADTGAVLAAPTFNDEIWAVEAYNGAVYVGGEFSEVNGERHPRLVKLNPDGSVDQAFNPRLRNGRVMDLHMLKDPVDPMLVVGGSSGDKLMALDPITGANTGYISLTIEEEIVRPDRPEVTAFGDVSVNNFAISPDRSKLVAVGNFVTVAGQTRMRAFMADLPADTSQSVTLSEWYYEPFQRPCQSITARRLAYLTDVDFSPDGSYFVMGATGFVTTQDSADQGIVTVCDAAARFETPESPDEMHPAAPTWINYTAGDSIWSVAVTGAAVYVQGHFQWMNACARCASPDDVVPGPDAVTRLGIGAIDPDDPAVDPMGGKALDWAPAKPAKQGGKQLLSTADGLWVVSDSRRFKGEPRYGIAFAPLP